MKTWKKNLIAAAVLVTVCTGIYLNWMYSEDQQTVDLTDTLNSEKLMDQDLLVMGDNTDLGDDLTVTSDYFAAVRLSRQQARASAVSLLQEAMAYGEEESAETDGQLKEIVQMGLCESQIESLVIAKGYADCVAYISKDGISVAVAAPEGGLQKTDVAVVADIVMSQSEYTLDDIHVVEVQ